MTKHTLQSDKISFADILGMLMFAIGFWLARVGMGFVSNRSVRKDILKQLGELKSAVSNEKTQATQ